MEQQQPTQKITIKMASNKMKNSNVKSAPITNGCGGKAGTKCYVELYIMPSSLSNLKVISKASQAVKK
jgi:hypothetical protein